MINRYKSRPRLMVALMAAVLALGGCAAPAQVGRNAIYDPYEAENRARHAENRAIDSRIVRPLAQRFGGKEQDAGPKTPGPVMRGISNFADNLDLPGMVVNNVLQFRLDEAAENTGRFLVNSTVGVLGIFDPAGRMGLETQEADFGETLYRWGAREGAYLELVGLGPTTERDLAGKVVDYLLNPLRFVIPEPESYVVTAAGLVEKLGDRSEYDQVVDDVLYNSADSYAQTRLLYLQRRRFELGVTSQSDYLDPYENNQ